MNKEIIKQQPNEENPIIVENYPYGFKRTKIRYWVESVKKKGDRFVSQTLNPKTNLWNKPKKSTYGAVNVVYEDEKGHITYYNLYWSTSKEDYQKFMDFKGDLVLNELQEEQLRRIRAYIKGYEGVKFECVNVTNQTEEEENKRNKEQNKIKNIIDNRIAYNYNNDNGVLN
mgnify:CR=1 FL=1|tara:strand:- start:450 stop:962 length:513 start_codon:yes stop_codon:yes gene_type:complete